MWVFMSCFVYACGSHALSNMAKGLLQHDVVKSPLERTMKLARIFRNSHVAIELLSDQKKNFKTPSQTIKSYSTIGWNGLPVLFTSGLVNNGVIGDVLTSQQMSAVKHRPV